MRAERLQLGGILSAVHLFVRARDASEPVHHVDVVKSVLPRFIGGKRLLRAAAIVAGGQDRRRGTGKKERAAND